MDLNIYVPIIKTEPGAHAKDGGETLHTEIDVDHCDLKDDCFIQHCENNRTAGGEVEALGALKGDDGSHETTHQNLTAQSSRSNSLPSTTHTSKKTRSNQRQMNHMIDFMTNHSEFAAGRYLGPQVAHTNRAMWEQLAEQLAEIGPAKSVDQWKTTWRDLKCKSRAKNAEAKRAALRTGSSSNVPFLADHTVKVINIIGRAISDGNALSENGTGEGPEEVVMEVEYDQPSTSYSSTSRPLSDPAAPSASCSGSDSGRRSRAEKRKRKRATLPEDLGNRMANAQETGNNSFNELVIAVNRIGDIFERFTAAYVESLEMRRRRERSRRSTTHQAGLPAYSSSDSDEESID